MAAASAQCCFRFHIWWRHLSSEGQNRYTLTKLKSYQKPNSSTYLNSRLRYNYFRCVNKRPPYWNFTSVATSTISHNRRAIRHQATNFRPNRATRGGVMTSLQFQYDGRGGSLLLPVLYPMTLHSSKGQNLSANRISSKYLNSWLRYSYFRFGKTNVRHIGIFLPVAILTTSQSSACVSASEYQISSKSVHPRPTHDVISIFAARSYA